MRFIYCFEESGAIAYLKTVCAVFTTAVTVTLTVNGVVQSVTDTYSAKQCADTILNDEAFRVDYIATENNDGRNGDERYQQLTTLVKTMLDYSAIALSSETTTQAAKALASAVYRYNAAANAYYGD